MPDGSSPTASGFIDRPLRPAERDRAIPAVVRRADAPAAARGILTLTFGLWYGVSRLAEDSLRIDKRFAGLTGSQWTALTVATVCAAVLVWFARHPDPNAPSGGGPARPDEPTSDERTVSAGPSTEVVA